jgi:carbonic anhydrase/acetyltransferase-like protein (isoleucine patch superfamily)
VCAAPSSSGDACDDDGVRRPDRSAPPTVRAEREAAFVSDPAAVAPPSALPRAPGWRDRLRAWRARGVEAGRDVVVGRGVVFDVARGGRVVLGEGAQLADGCRFHVAAGATATVGAGTRLGDRCVVTAQRSVTIGARCVLGDEVVLVDAAPVTADVERPVREQGLAARPVVVGDDVRIGPSAALLAGGTVASGATVAAHAVLS